MPKDTFEAAIIGTGQAALPLASYLNDRNIKTIVFEKYNVGGVCVNTGCTPTKTAIASASVAHTVQSAESFGIRTGDVRTNWIKVRKRVRSIVKDSRVNVSEAFEELKNVELVFGEAQFLDNRTIEVNGKKGARKISVTGEIYINAGTKPRVPEIPGLTKTPYLTSNSILSIERLPKKLIILGGGYIGLEYSQLFRRLGSEVVVLDENSRLLPKEDEDVAKEILEILTGEGIEFRFNVKVNSVEFSNKNDSFVLKTNGQPIKGSDLLIAVGRKSTAKKLAAQKAGIELDDRDYIKTDGYLKTNVDHIYALGDIRGKLQFTTVAYDDFRHIRDRLNGKSRSIEDRTIPYVAYIEPEFARIGLSEQEAEDQNVAVEVKIIRCDRIARLKEMNRTEGLLKALVSKEDNTIVGFAALCERAGDLIAYVQVLMHAKYTVDQILDLPSPHPTIPEGLDTLLSS